MIFISYAHEDVVVARRLSDDLVKLGYDVWFDETCLLPGQIWELQIRQAIQQSAYFLALLSGRSVSKRGYVQRELKEGLDVYSQLPEGTAFLVPVRLEPCEMPSRTLRGIQWVDLFSDYDTGLARILKLLERDLATSPEHSSQPQDVPERVNPVDGSILVRVPAGTYVIGSDNLPSRLRAECRSWSHPAHLVSLSEFWISKYPITNAQYDKFLGSNPEYPQPMYWETAEFNGPKQPVVGVSWYDASAYCKWADLTLPTEAQWEAAARGPDARTYPWGYELPTPGRANFGTNIGRTTDVDTYVASSGPFNTVDQAGNIWEWCLDAWAPDAYQAHGHLEQDPVLEVAPSSGRSIRGGSAVYDAEYLIAAVRERIKSDHNSRLIGFRCVWTEK